MAETTRSLRALHVGTATSVRSAPRFVHLSKRQFATLAILILAFAAAIRFVDLGADPPGWTSPDFLTDTGWWADSARGSVLFNNYFSDSFGTSLLMTPAYTGILRAVFLVAGVGTYQERAVAAVAGILTVLAVGALLLRLFGRTAALVGAVMLAISPLAWTYSRIGLIEMTQAFLIASGFALWLAGESAVTAAGAGIALALAVWTKPNAVFLGVVPILCAAAVELISDFGSGGTRTTSVHGRRFALATVGFLAVFGAILGLVIAPHWNDFVSMAISESHAGSTGLLRFLTIPGIAFMTTITSGNARVPEVWQVAQWSPALFLAVWGLLIFLATRRQIRPDLHLTSKQLACIAWFLSTLFFVSVELQQPARRLVLLLPTMAVCAGMWASMSAGELNSQNELRGECGPRTYWQSFLRWALILFPILVGSKPWISRALMAAGATWPIGAHKGLSYSAAGTIVTAVWLAGVLAVAGFRNLGVRAGRLMIRLALPLAIVALVAFELPAVILGLAGSSHTFLATQKALSAYVTGNRADGSPEVIMGHVASTFFLPYHVRTVRRSLPADESPPPNPGIWESTRPEYIIALRTFDYSPMRPRYADLIREHHYSRVGTYSIGPERNGAARFVVDVYGADLSVPDVHDPGSTRGRNTLSLRKTVVMSSGGQE